MMACKYLLAGRTSVGEMENPANSTVSSAKQNFLGLRVMPFTAQICMQPLDCLVEGLSDVA